MIKKFANSQNKLQTSMVQMSPQTSLKAPPTIDKAVFIILESASSDGFLLTFDPGISDAFDIVAAEEEEQDHYGYGIEHGSNQGQVPLRLVLLLKYA